MRKRLVAFLDEKVKEKKLAFELNDDTSLIKSGLLDSADLVELATWIEGQIDPGFDLSAFDLPEAWDTVVGILHFVEGHCRSDVDFT